MILVAVAVAMLFLASWIVVPAPTVPLLTLGVAVSEVSPFLLLLSVVLAVSALFTGGTFAHRAAAALAIAASALYALPLVQAATSIPRFDAVFAAAGIKADGGAWQRGAPADDAALARYFAAHGYIVFAIDYRHAPRWQGPAQIEDVRAALGWIRLHAAEYQGDPARLALIGRSSGGQLALAAAYSDSATPIAERLRAAGAKPVLLQIPWAEHAFDAVPFGLSAQISLYYTERFLASTLR